MTISRLLAIGSLMVIAGQTVQAQSIASSVSAVRDGKVRMTFASRDNICGYGNGISTTSGSRRNWSSSRSVDVEYDAECSEGPVRVVAEIESGRVMSLRAYVGGGWRVASNITDLGTVGARQATDWLMSVASTHSGKAAGNAIFATTLADSVNIAQSLTQFADNESHPKEARKQALFWAGQNGASMSQLASIYARTSERDMKDQIIFVFSQRRDPAAIDKLMDIAKNDPDREARRKALFWLAQSKDPRALTMLSDIINRQE